MLKKFSVKGYRNFKDEFAIDFSDVRDYRFNSEALKDGMVKCALLYGRNAVGKTNFARALFDIKNNIGLYPLVYDPAFLNADNETGLAEFSYLFLFDDVEVLYSYKKDERAELVHEKLSFDEAVVFEYDHLSSSMVVNGLFSVGADGLNWEFHDQGMSILSYVCNNTPSESLGVLHSLYDFIRGISAIRNDYHVYWKENFSRFVEDVIRRDRVKDLEAFLNRFGVEERLVVADSPSGEQVLYFKHERLIPFVNNCSSGTVSLLRLFRVLEMGFTNVSPSFLFVDEFDSFYHHDLAESVVGYFKDSGCHQVLCATHNTDLFSNKILRPDCLFVMTKEGISSASSATKRELREGHNLEKLYKAGEFDV